MPFHWPKSVASKPYAPVVDVIPDRTSPVHKIAVKVIPSERGHYCAVS